MQLFLSELISDSMKSRAFLRLDGRSSVSCYNSSETQSAHCNRVEAPLALFSNKTFATYIELLGEDGVHPRCACSLVSSVFRYFCSPTFYRDVTSDQKEKVVALIRVRERFDPLQRVKSLNLTYGVVGTKTHLCKPRHNLSKSVAPDPPSQDPVSRGTSHSIAILSSAPRPHWSHRSAALGDSKILYSSSSVPLFTSSCTRLGSPRSCKAEPQMYTRPWYCPRLPRSYELIHGGVGRGAL